MTARRLRNDDGVASVEFAFLLPILLLLAIVAAEFGFAFMDWMAVSNGTRTGARIAAAGGDAPGTDLAVLAGIEDALSGAPRATITSVDIFEVLGDGSQGPTNSYAYSGGFGGCAPCAWPESARDTTLGSLDVVGVRVNFDHSWVVGFWDGSDAAWSDTKIIRLEPDFGQVGS